MSKNYDAIVRHYETCLEEHGDNHKGVDWPRLEDVDKRYKVMLDIIRIREDASGRISLLDFGCGTAHLYEYLLKNSTGPVQYSGLDISPRFIEVASAKHPDITFYCGDVLDDAFDFPNHDYLVLNGVFTEKRTLTFEEMWDYFTRVLKRVFLKSNKGIAFNVMSKNVDWERDDLFHVPLDTLTQFLCAELSRNFVIRNDYGLYEYTVYVYQ